MKTVVDYLVPRRYKFTSFCGRIKRDLSSEISAA